MLSSRLWATLAWAVRRSLSSASSAAVSAPQQAQGVEQGRQMAGLDATLGQRQLVGLLVQRIEHLTAQAQRCLLWRCRAWRLAA
jgi:hypothetical protein